MRELLEQSIHPAWVVEVDPGFTSSVEAAGIGGSVRFAEHPAETFWVGEHGSHLVDGGSTDEEAGPDGSQPVTIHAIQPSRRHVSGGGRNGTGVNRCPHHNLLPRGFSERLVVFVAGASRRCGAGEGSPDPARRTQLSRRHLTAAGGTAAGPAAAVVDARRPPRAVNPRLRRGLLVSTHAIHTAAELPEMSLIDCL